MGLKDIGEFGFISRISPQCLIRRDGVYKAIGDDSAAFWAAQGELTLLTTDLLVEGVHFYPGVTSGFNLGQKALAVNLSDIAAMGGTAREAFVSLGIPERYSLAYLDDLYRGMQHLAREFSVNILGGDTTGSRQDLIINIALTGSVSENEILCRDRAIPGDLICSTGCLGDSRAGLHLILKSIPRDTPELDKLFQAHVLPRPCLREGRFLAAAGATAAIDVSDGLSSDLSHLLASSGTGARIKAGQLPISAELESFCARFGFDPVEFALAGGEDYTLLFTVRPDEADRLADGYQEEFGSVFRILGEMTDTGRLELVTASESIVPLEPGGWNHFQQDGAS
ncbi:MAG: thiamine-phosphate kinase [Desulfohalobiaceae bacterium]|nr:thiamine-phosphate kinase [Desulfohalobiaceae bacterium]